MDIDRLRYFHTVVQTQSLRKASELLNISPPALSKSIKALEEQLGAKLIIADGRGIAITDDGRRVAEQARKIIKEADVLLNSSTLRKEKPLLRLGSSEVFTTYFLGSLVDNHMRDYDLELHELVPGAMEEAIANRKIDLGISYVPIPHVQLDFLKVTELKMRVYALKGVFESHEFAELPFACPITPIEGSPNRIRGLDGWPDDRLPRHRKYQVTLMETALELCRRGLAVSYLPVFIANLHNKTVKEEYKLIPLENAPNPRSVAQEVYICKRKSDQEGETTKQLARALRLICSNTN
jgi:DNA-binding transcriptional LysR family regulator